MHELLRPAARVLAAALVALAASGARAEVFREPRSGLALDLSRPGARVCFIRPAQLRGDPADCEGLAVEAAEQRLTPDIRLSAIVRLEDWDYSVHASWQNKPHPGPMSREEARDVFRGIVNATKSGVFRVEQAEPELLVLDDLQVIRVRMLPRTASDSSAALTYLVVGKTDLVTLVFLSDTGHLDALEKTIEPTLATLRMPPDHVPAAWEDSPWKSPAFEVGYQLGRAVGGLVALGGICFAAVMIYRSTRRGRTRPPPRPPPPPPMQA